MIGIKKPRKVTIVSEHPMHVPASKKNPTGVTIRDRHVRHVEGNFYSNGRALGFAAVVNEYGGCYDAYSPEKKLSLSAVSTLAQQTSCLSRLDWTLFDFPIF